MTAQTRQPIGREKIELRHSQPVACSSRLIPLYILIKKPEYDFENFIVVILNAQINVERRLLRFLLHTLLSSLELPQLGRLAH